MLGYTVFAGIVPPSLLSDLRRVCQRARELARERSGPRAQRLQPVFEYDLDHRPFTDFAELPELVDAVHRTLSPEHTYGRRDLGVLLEPADEPWCTHWHRDWRDNVARPRPRALGGRLPGPRALQPAELRPLRGLLHLGGARLPPAARPAPRGGALPRPAGAAAGAGGAHLGRAGARLGLEYCRSLPGARQLHLGAGDFCLYRNTLWHIGSYVPYRTRATLHDHVDTPAYRAWREGERRGGEAAAGGEGRVPQQTMNGLFHTAEHH